MRETQCLLEDVLRPVRSRIGQVRYIRPIIRLILGYMKITSATNQPAPPPMLLDGAMIHGLLWHSVT